MERSGRGDRQAAKQEGHGELADTDADFLAIARFFNGGVGPGQQISLEQGLDYAIQIGKRTVETHRSRVMVKMGADSLAQLIRMYMDFQQRETDEH